MKSEFLKLAKSDYAKGLIVTMLTVIVSSLVQLLNNGEIPFTFMAWKPIILASLSAGGAYLLKNIFTNSNGEPLKKETNI